MQARSPAGGCRPCARLEDATDVRALCQTVTGGKVRREKGLGMKRPTTERVLIAGLLLATALYIAAVVASLLR
jgi:hypothetical protein